LRAQGPARTGTPFASNEGSNGDHKVRRSSSARIRIPGGRAEELAARAHRLRRKGELRRAAVTLREACALDERNPARWVQLGDVLYRMGKREEAADAMKQSVYLREQAGEKSKANVVRRLILKLARPPRG
jgi:Flp pilus assembly protein TadD